ncbi:MAG: precorrin-3B C(17)-methyltransferase [Desulfobacterales bacterium]|nr:precorrin-3B C(17)-methyltransferase [Desulfobacterales bacterium]
MSGRARQVIESADTICGYTTYIDLVRPLIGQKPVIATGMTREVERVWQAIETARSGGSCALVCSGDPGVYAMAGLVFELCRNNHVAVGSGETDALNVEIVPGIPALSAGAALLGAPLMHDFAAISLSDLLTPWPVIEKRIQMAAEADFAIVFYNPRSKKRDWQLEAARQILLGLRSGDTPVGLTTAAMRDGQSVSLCTLETLDCTKVGMQTTVFVGNSQTFVYGDRMVTPRGYDGKYDLVR